MTSAAKLACCLRVRLQVQPTRQQGLHQQWCSQLVSKASKLWGVLTKHCLAKKTSWGDSYKTSPNWRASVHIIFFYNHICILWYQWYLLCLKRCSYIFETNFDAPRYPASPCACTVGITTRRCTRDLHPLHEPRSWESLSKIDPWDSCIVNYDCTWIGWEFLDGKCMQKIPTWTFFFKHFWERFPYFSTAFSGNSQQAVGRPRWLRLRIWRQADNMRD